MPKPRRKHPGFNALQLSLQGRQFLNFLANAVGDDLAWRAVGSTRDRFHVYEVRGERDRVVLVEAPMAVEDGVCVERTAFRHEVAGVPLVAQVEIVAHRIDPWIWADRTGDRTIVEMPERARRREADRRSEELGAVSDRLSFTLAPDAAGPVAGLSCDRIEELIQEAIRRGDRPAAAKRVGELIACPVCGALCTPIEAAEHICGRFEFSVN